MVLKSHLFYFYLIFATFAIVFAKEVLVVWKYSFNYGVLFFDRFRVLAAVAGAAGEHDGVRSRFFSLVFLLFS